jgi:hypothetical protein
MAGERNKSIDRYLSWLGKFGVGCKNLFMRKKRDARYGRLAAMAMIQVEL